MIGDPAQFETIGNRLGFEIVENTREKLRLVWHGARFPAFLCLGIAVLLLFVSVPIIEALRLRGFADRRDLHSPDAQPRAIGDGIG